MTAMTQKIEHGTAVSGSDMQAERNWGGYLAAGLLFVAGWLMVQSYADPPRPLATPGTPSINLPDTSNTAELTGAPVYTIGN